MAATASPSASPLLLPGQRSASRAWLRGSGRASFIRGSNSRALSCSEAPCRCNASAGKFQGADDGSAIVCSSSTRRAVVGAVVLGVSSSAFCLQAALDAFAAGLPPEEKPKLCDDACVKELENVPMVTTESGLQYKDIKVGQGPSPPIGFQVAANCVAMVPPGQIFDSSLEKGQPYIFRVGAGQLAFPKGLNSAPGRPRVAPSSPVIFDVNLLFIPGLDDE
ncbi:unnamed protein product [Alopecurus aequalis]